MALRMASDTTEADTTALYLLECTDCSFEATVEGDLDDALEIADNHQEGNGVREGDHFVDFELRDRD